MALTETQNVAKSDSTLITLVRESCFFENLSRKVFVLAFVKKSHVGARRCEFPDEISGHPYYKSYYWSCPRDSVRL